MKAMLPILIALSSPIATAQDTTKHDPLLGGYFFANSVEIVSITDSVSGPGAQTISQRILDLTPARDVTSGEPYLMASALHSARWSDCIAGDFNDDGKVEIVTAWINPSGMIQVEAGNVTRLKPDYAWDWSSGEVYGEGPYDGVSEIRLVGANLDGVPPAEILLCILDPLPPNGILFISVLHVDASGRISRVGSDSFMSGYPFDVAAGDLDGDETDEIMHVSRQIEGSYDRMVIERYDYNTVTGLFNFIGSSGVPGSNWGNWKRLKVTLGDFRNIGRKEAVVSLTLRSGNSGRQVFNYITYWGGDVPQFSLPLPGESPAGWSWGNGWESDAVAADLNVWKDDGDELVVAGPGEVAVLKFDASLKPVYLAKTPFLYSNTLETYERRRFLAVADVDADTSSGPWMQEIIVAEHLQDSTSVLRILAPTLDFDHNITGLTQKYVSPPGTKSLKSEIAVGDFDGDATRLGTPTLVTKDFVYQPIVELNVPPTHFDYINGQTYDVCKVFGAQPSQFKVKYTETQSQTSRFSSELSQSWGVSGEISGGFSLFGVKVKGYVKASYDRGYYGSRTLDTTTTTSQMTESWGDDWILATVTDYDFWEYPLYTMGNRLGNVLVVIPHYRSTEWFPRRNVIARNWVADHEVGNLFSYVTAGGIGGWTGTNLLTSFLGKTISRSSAGIWSLDLSTQTIDDSKLTSKIGTEVGLSVEKWGIEAKVSGRYSRDEISTHTSTATKSVQIDVTVSETDQLFGDADYLVTPYIYWGDDGALVVDYAVDPSSSGNPEYGTFWDKNYLSKSDPGFILPWRLDSLKGIGGTQNMKLYSTSMHISPVGPAAGDVLHLTARVHNFSLKNTDDSVTVRFYLGNPANGGTPIVSIDGQTDLKTEGLIPARGRATVAMDWIVPPGLDKSAKIFAVIDPENLLDEIHKDNNVGFVPLMVQDASGIEEETVLPLPEHYVLQQNYPNPFNPSTVIPYELSARTRVTIAVYDILGRTVATLVNGVREAGRHHVVFDAKGLATGVYFYRLSVSPEREGQAGSFVQTRKLLLLR